MFIESLFQRRIQEDNGLVSEIFSYALTQEFKNRFVMLVTEYIQRKHYESLDRHRMGLDSFFTQRLQYSFGVLSLRQISGIEAFSPLQELQYAILYSEDTVVLSIVEFICRYFKEEKSFIEAVNDYFGHDRIGYKFVSEGQGFIIKITDEKFFETCTQKCLTVLTLKNYPDVQNFYIVAYQHLADERYGEALVNLVRALETLLKARFHEKGIAYNDKKDSLGKLLEIAQKHITTAYNFQYFKQVILEIGRGRNSMGAHGITPGETAIADAELVRFAFNQTAANLLFLAEVEIQ